MTPSGIEPATFWFVAQHLNHCATVEDETIFKNIAVKLNVKHYSLKRTNMATD